MVGEPIINRDMRNMDGITGCFPYHCGRHDPKSQRPLVITLRVVSRKHLPSSGADNPLALVLFLDGIKFKIDVLADVTNKRKDLADTVVNHGECSEAVDNRAGDGLCPLLRARRSVDDWIKKEKIPTDK
jgi:hypothetical protein